MKFGKRLVAEAVPEWATKYMDYADMKKKLKWMEERSGDEDELTFGM